eukprot:216260-Amphidinium_carterae.1
MQLNPVASVKLSARLAEAGAGPFAKTERGGQQCPEYRFARSSRSQRESSARLVTCSLIASLAVMGSRSRAASRVPCTASEAGEEAPLKNVAMVFVKPHAYTGRFLTHVASFLQEKGIN